MCYTILLLFSFVCCCEIDTENNRNGCTMVRCVGWRLFSWTEIHRFFRLDPPLSDPGQASDLISDTGEDEAYQWEETCDRDPSCSNCTESIKSHLSMWTAHVLPALTGHTQRGLNYYPVLLNSRIISYYRGRMRVLFVWSFLPNPSSSWIPIPHYR